MNYSNTTKPPSKHWPTIIEMDPLVQCYSIGMKSAPPPSLLRNRMIIDQQFLQLSFCKITISGTYDTASSVIIVSEYISKASFNAQVNKRLANVIVSQTQWLSQVDMCSSIHISIFTRNYCQRLTTSVCRSLQREVFPCCSSVSKISQLLPVPELDDSFLVLWQ